MVRRCFATVLVLTLALACGGSNGSGSGSSASPTAPTAASGPRAGLWNGTLPSAPAGSGTLSFRVTNSTGLTFVSTRVPTFSNMNGCATSWTQTAAIDAGGNFSVTLTSGNTVLTIAGRFDSDSAATGTVTGTCSGALMLLGQTFRAAWASN